MAIESYKVKSFYLIFRKQTGNRKRVQAITGSSTRRRKYVRPDGDNETRTDKFNSLPKIWKSFGRKVRGIRPRGLLDQK